MANQYTPIAMLARIDKKTARRIADGLTWARIWSAIPITVVAWFDLKWWVLCFYAAAALTDFFDGVFARRATLPERETDFDGKADIVFSIMTLVWLWMLVPGFIENYWFPYLPVLIAIEVYLIAARVRWPGIHIPHFEFGRKGMVLFCFLLPVLLVIGDIPWFVHTVFVVGMLAKMQLAWYIFRCDPAEQASV